MENKKEKVKFPSELRFDLISKDWVVIATGRAKRPEMFKKEKREKITVPEEVCPFCNVSEPPILTYFQGKKVSDSKNWTTMVVPNKYPAFLPADKLEINFEGKFYQAMNAVGYCELVVTRDHQKQLALLETRQIKEVIDAYQERYLELIKRPFVRHVSIFHNEGADAGASQPHPHSQIITSPLVDIDLQRALLNSQSYFKKTKKCIYCQIQNWELKNKKRIIFENKDFLALCPFASKAAFEVIISPKKHFSYFEKITEGQKTQLAEAFLASLNKIYKALNDPPYNFYLHTAPSDKKKYPYYHWHWTILPKTGIWAGFELGARMEISTIAPEKAAEYLRKQ